MVVRENYLRATNAIVHFPYLVPDIAAKSCCQCQITFVITSSPLLPHTTQLVTSRQLHCRAYQNYGYYGEVCLAQKKMWLLSGPPNNNDCNEPLEVRWAVKFCRFVSRQLGTGVTTSLNTCVSNHDPRLYCTIRFWLWWKFLSLKIRTGWKRLVRNCLLLSFWVQVK